jgi:hypothetical protein
MPPPYCRVKHAYTTIMIVTAQPGAASLHMPDRREEPEKEGTEEKPSNVDHLTLIKYCFRFTQNCFLAY